MLCSGCGPLIQKSQFAAVSQDAQSASAPAPPKSDGYTLVWCDEFDKDGPPSDANWIYETGFLRNGELQWYQAKNARCEGGMLILEARRERVPNPNHNPSPEFADKCEIARTHADYTSAALETRGKHEWTYGRFEMRGRIDTRAGLWPAFWTLGTKREWPECGEIDIMEYFRDTLLANAFWGSEKQWVPAEDVSKAPLAEIAKAAGFENAEAWSRAFHVWRMDWERDAIKLYVDGALLNEIDLATTVNRTPDKANPFHEPHYILLNLAIGGSQGGDPSKTDFPARFEVDWVRVYQKKDADSGQKPDSRPAR